MDSVRIIEVLANHLEMDPSEITEETTFADLGVDSLDDLPEIAPEHVEEFREEAEEEAEERLSVKI